MAVRRRYAPREDVVRTTLSEIVLFLLFFSLILLGTQSVLQQPEGEVPPQPPVDPCEVAPISCVLPTPRPVPEPETGARWPPYFVLDHGAFSFDPNSAVLSEEFQDNLRARIDDIVDQINNSELEITAIEIIGHTDGQEVQTTETNLDTAMFDYLAGDQEASTLTAGDNAGLGLIRALSVRQFLLEDGRLGVLEIIPLSAGQLVLPSGEFSDEAGGDEADRRRIEIRLRGDGALFE